MRFEVYSENPIVVRETTHLLTKLQYELRISAGGTSRELLI